MVRGWLEHDEPGLRRFRALGTKVMSTDVPPTLDSRNREAPGVIDPGDLSADTVLVPVSVVIPTLDEASRVHAAVSELQWADEVIVVDGGSADDTVAQAEAAGAA